MLSASGQLALRMAAASAAAAPSCLAAAGRSGSYRGAALIVAAAGAVAHGSWRRWRQLAVAGWRWLLQRSGSHLRSAHHLPICMQRQRRRHHGIRKRIHYNRKYNGEKLKAVAGWRMLAKAPGEALKTCGRAWRQWRVAMAMRAI